MSATIYTIGYATKPIDVFVEQLKHYQIDVVADVRSVPYSKVFHDYHREPLTAKLKSHSIAYAFIGDELGPRSKNPQHYDCSGQVQFDRLMNSRLFAEGVQRLDKGLSKGFTIALMCAEKDPATCHRSLLIAYFLARHGLGDHELDSIVHIAHNGDIEKQSVLEHRLCDIHNLNEDLFASPAEQMNKAYELQLKHTSYCKPDDEI